MESKPILSNEDNLILTCSAQVLNDRTRIDIIKKISENKLDWEYILKKAALNKVSSLIYKNLQSINRDYPLIPNNVLESLKNSYISTSRQNLRVLYDLAKVLSAFQETSVKVMVIKGASLIERVYQDIGFRGMLDIDIIVQEKDFSVVKKILRQLNYTIENEHFDPIQWSPVPLDYHLCFQKNETYIEIKFCIYGLDFPDFEIEKMWEEAERVKIAEQETLIPSPEYALLIICIALVRHAFAILICYCDIKELINFYKDRLNWEKLLSIAREKEVGVPTFYGLFFAKRLVKAEVPDYVLESLRPNYLRRKIFELLWNKEAILNFQGADVYRKTKTLNIPHEFKMIFFCGKLNFRPDKLSKLLGYIFRAVFPPKRFLTKRYLATHGASGSFFFYILRLLRYWLRIFRSGFLLPLRK